MKLDPKNLVHFSFKNAHASATPGGIRITPQHASGLPHIAATTLIESTALLLESDMQGGASGSGLRNAKMCLHAFEIDQVRQALESALNEQLEPKDDNPITRILLAAENLRNEGVSAFIHLFRHRTDKTPNYGIETHGILWIPQEKNEADLADSPVKLSSAKEMEDNWEILKVRRTGSLTQESLAKDFQSTPKVPNLKKKEELAGTIKEYIAATPKETITKLVNSNKTWYAGRQIIEDGSEHLWLGNGEWAVKFDEPTQVLEWDEIEDASLLFGRQQIAKKTKADTITEFFKKALKPKSSYTAEEVEEIRQSTKDACKYYQESSTESVDQYLPQILIPKDGDYVALTPLSAAGVTGEIQSRFSKCNALGKQECKEGEYFYNLPTIWKDSFSIGGAQSQNVGILTDMLRNTIDFLVPVRDNERRKAWGIFHQGFTPWLLTKPLNEYANWVLQTRNKEGVLRTSLKLRQKEQALLQDLLRGPYFQAKVARELLQKYRNRLPAEEECNTLLHRGWLNPQDRDPTWRKALGEWLAQAIKETLPKARGQNPELLLGKSDEERIETQVTKLICLNW